MAEIATSERARLRELLLDGLLVANGVADRAALEAFLNDAGPSRDFDFARVLQIADAERWARLRI
jgi:asparagine synthase (glutamine-hydrolysing)